MDLGNSLSDNIPHDLKPGEWQLFCPHCDYRGEKNTAEKSICPECGKRMHVAEERQCPTTSAILTNVYIDSETDARLHKYGIQACDCPNPVVKNDELQKHLERAYSMKELRVPCGGGDDFFYARLEGSLHFEGKHWHEACLLVELADRLWRKG